jgi:hypothetical protein
MKKRRVGRPSKGDDAKKVPVMVKLSKKELRVFRAAAKGDGMALGPWLIWHRRQELEK